MGVLRVAFMLGLIGFCAGGAFASPVYFLVSENPEAAEHGDSFVLPLTEAADIAHARDLIARGPDIAGAPIITADIVAGGDNINRDILATGKPAWSWHISQFTGFADFTIELVDGWPTFVEQDVQGWMDNTNPPPPASFGRIGFWNYTVTAELIGPATDLSIAPSVIVPLPAALPVGAVLLAAALTPALRAQKRHRPR